jgi:hypothetical protein
MERGLGYKQREERSELPTMCSGAPVINIMRIQPLSSSSLSCSPQPPSAAILRGLKKLLLHVSCLQTSLSSSPPS